MANKVLLVAKSRIEANRLAPDYGISRFTYVFGAASVRRLVPSDTVWLLPGWEGNPAKFAIENALRYTRATVKRPAPVDVEPVEMQHCDGCGEDYNALEESHVGHEPMPPLQKQLQETLEKQDAKTLATLQALKDNAPEPNADGTVTFQVSGDIPQRDYDFSGPVDHSIVDAFNPETGEIEPTPPPAPPMPDDWDSIVTTDKNDVEELFPDNAGGEPGDPEEPSAETAAPKPSQDPEEAPAEVEPTVKRRRRRCKECGILVEPDDVEAHAATHVEG